MDKYNSNIRTYVNRLGNTTFIVKNYFDGTKTLAEAFEEIIINSFRNRYSDDNNFDMCEGRKIEYR